MGAPVQVGDLLADNKYEVTRILGRGGMGVVVAARHRELDKLVALKFMHEELSTVDEATERFLREARAAARLRNEHIAQVLDVARLPGGVPYIVMEYLEGRDLAQVVERDGLLPIADAVEYMVQVCEAMAEAHAQGIVHRDLKPQNLFLTTHQDGRPLVKVLDFGISKALYAQSPTSTAQTMGSPMYMAPEQMRSSRTVDPRADIWSIGVILYQLLSNTLPFSGDNATEVMLKVLQDPVPPLGGLRAGVPPRLVATIERCLEKDRERRFANVAELARELVVFAPERARAALALIEQITAADPARPITGSSVPMVVPAGAATTQTSLKLHSGGDVAPVAKTTLGAAASSVHVAALPNRTRSRALALAVLALASVVAIVLIARSRGRSAPDTPGELRAIGTAADAPALPSDAASVAIGDAANPSGDRATAPTLDAAIAATRPAPVDARPPRRKRPDAATTTTTTIDAPVLEPARPDDEPLQPAR